jgi:O-antigen ligase
MIAPGAVRRISPVLCVLLVTMGLWFSSVAPSFESVQTTLSTAVPSLVRDEGTSLFTGREVIWQSSFDAFRNGDQVERMIGWGANGQLTSGAADGFGFNRKLRGSTYAHSSVIQILLDSGALGVALFLVIVAFAVTAAARARDQAVALALCCGLLLLGGISATDVILSPSVLSVPFVAFVVLCAAAFKRDPDIAPEEDLHLSFTRSLE